jgi:hypothetical protein
VETIRRLQVLWEASGLQRAEAVAERETRLSHSRMDDFIEWLQNPGNTHYEEHENARAVFRVGDDLRH